MRGLLTFVTMTSFLRRGSCLPESLVVQVTGGHVQGSIVQNVIRFLGIPYGNAQRFQLPTGVVHPWTGVMNASVVGPQCPQQCPPVIRKVHCLQNDQMSETCLSLNVYRPAYNLPADHGFPVMVFIHGGNFLAGSGGAPMYDGSFLATLGEVIVVTINYRLGALGFLPIFNEYDDITSNFGFRDQQLALYWIRTNIASFDGDPNKIVLFGAGAGCTSVGLHLVSSTSRPLFTSAIMHSCPLTLPFRQKNESHQLVRDFAASLGCRENDVACYRQKSSADILQAQSKVTYSMGAGVPSLRQFQEWGPVVDKREVHDGHLLEELALMTSGLSRRFRKSVLIGTVEDEGSTVVNRHFPLSVSAEYFRQLLQGMSTSQDVDSPAWPYVPEMRNDARREMAQFVHDFVYACPARYFAGLFDKNSTVGRNGLSGNEHEPKIWIYSFQPAITWSPGQSAWPPGGEAYCKKVACHVLDLLYLFNSHAVPESRRTEIESLAKIMAFYWTNFAHYGDPNGRTVRPASLQISSLPTDNTLTAEEIQSIGLPSIMFPSSFLRHSMLHLRKIESLAPTFPSPPGSMSNKVQGTIISLTSSSGNISASGIVYWPPYVKDDSALPEVNVTLILTQPVPLLQQTLSNTGRCDFWDKVGYN